MTVRGFSAVIGGRAVGAGAAMGGTVATVLGGGATVVTVSGGSWGLADGLGGAVGGGIAGAVVTVRGIGPPTVALVVALSPLLIITAVAMAPRATTLPTIPASGRHRRSA